MKKCDKCFYQYYYCFGGVAWEKICQHKSSMEGTGVKSDYCFCEDITECDYYTPCIEMGDAYRIIKITDKEGKDRTEGDYSLRIGRLCKTPAIRNDRVGDYAVIPYLENADGSDYSGLLTTSYVLNIQETENTTILETQNSIYYLKREEYKKM